MQFEKESIVQLPNTSSINDSTLLLSAERVAELLDISIRTLWRLRAAGKLPAPIHLGGSVRWRTRDIEAWIASGCPKDSKSRRG
jgi:excisionase family DNA binding protein